MKKALDTAARDSKCFFHAKQISMKLKHISTLIAFCLGSGSLLPAAASTGKDKDSESQGNSPKEETQFVISAEIRERGVYSHGYEQPLRLDQKGSFFVGQRTRLNFDFRKGPTGFFVQIEDGRIWGETNGSHSQGLGIAQAYFHYDIGKGFGFKVGRMPLHYEDGRYLSYSSWDECPKTHDALVFSFRSRDKKTKADIGASFSNTSDSYFLNPYGLDNYFKYLLIGYVSHQFAPDLRIGLLSVTDFQERKYWDAGLEDYAYDPGRIYGRSTVGLYLDLFKGRKVSALAYGYGQFGRLNTGRHVASGLASVKMKYKAMPKIELQLGYDFVSGDWMDEGSEYARDFSKFLGSTHSFLGIMDFFSPGSRHSSICGLHQPQLSIIFRPAPKHSLELTGRYFWTVARPGLTILDGPDIPGAETTYDSRDLGFEGSLIYKYSIRPDLSLEAGYALHTPTETLEILNEMMPGSSKFAHFGYVMISYKPTLFNLANHRKGHDD